MISYGMNRNRAVGLQTWNRAWHTSTKPGTDNRYLPKPVNATSTRLRPPLSLKLWQRPHQPTTFQYPRPQATRSTEEIALKQKLQPSKTRVVDKNSSPQPLRWTSSPPNIFPGFTEHSSAYWKKLILPHHWNHLWSPKTQKQGSTKLHPQSCLKNFDFSVINHDLVCVFTL